MRGVCGTTVLIRRYSVGLGIAAAVITVDLLTKRWASIEFAGNPVTIIDGFLGFTFVENPGAAFGLFRSGGSVIALAAIVISAVVLVAMAFPRPHMELAALGLVLGGAVGNLVDRVARGPGLVDGKVIDWIELWFIPTFNIADMAVNAAVVLLLIQAWRTRSD